MNEIKIMPEFWQSRHYEIKWKYIDLNNGLWNVGTINNNIVNLWTINVHGRFYRRAINIHEFKATYKERIY